MAIRGLIIRALYVFSFLLIFRVLIIRILDDLSSPFCDDILRKRHSVEPILGSD
jgi:hypothetical protein